MKLISKIKILGLKTIYDLLNLITYKIRISNLIKLKIAIGLTLISSKAIVAQTVDFPNRVNKADTLNLDVEMENGPTLCYEVVIIDKSGKSPEFRGGDEELNKFVKENVKYPKEAIDNKIEGDVSVNVTVDKDGKILDSYVITKKGYGLDEEALRLVKLMPEFKPGKVKGKKRKMNRTIIIHFELPKD